MSNSWMGFFCFILMLIINPFVFSIFEYFLGSEATFLVDYSWVTYIISFIIAAWVMTPVNNFFSRDRKKICAWCNNKKINFVSGKERDWFWEYRNKDGSKDQRVKDNFQQAGFSSVYQCNKCGAKTNFVHTVDRKPSQNIKIWRRILSENGSGERTGTDILVEGSIKVNEENRKGN